MATETESHAKFVDMAADPADVISNFTTLCECKTREDAEKWVETTHAWVQDGGNIHYVNMAGMTALYFACSEMTGTVARALVEEFDVVVNRQNMVGKTPAHMAVSNGNVEALRALLDNGADPLIEDGQGRRPRDYSCPLDKPGFYGCPIGYAACIELLDCSPVVKSATKK